MTIMSISEEAARDIKAKIGDAGVRVGVKAGGCAGLEFYMEPTEDVFDPETEVEFFEHGVRFVMNKRSRLFLEGGSIELEPGLFGGIRVKPPGGSPGCSCGKSFSGG